MSGGMWVRARGMKDRNPFTQRVVQQTACLATFSMTKKDNYILSDETFSKIINLM